LFWRSSALGPAADGIVHDVVRLERLERFAAALLAKAGAGTMRRGHYGAAAPRNRARALIAFVLPGSSATERS
jgi:hypothetical protein